MTDAELDAIEASLAGAVVAGPWGSPSTRRISPEVALALVAEVRRVREMVAALVVAP